MIPKSAGKSGQGASLAGGEWWLGESAYSVEGRRIAPRVTGRFGRHLRTRPNERIYAIGDIHGRLDLFTALLRLIEADNAARMFDEAVASIVVLGDFIDRGPQSREMVSLLRRSSELAHFTVLLGNHEACLLDCADGRADPRDGWLDFGGAETLASFGIAPPRDDEDCLDFAERLTAGIGRETLDWLAGLPLSERSGDFFFCHAGIRPKVNLARQTREDLLWIREPFLSNRANHGAVIVHGHSISGEIDVAANRIGIDTGAYATGRLTALGLAGEELWWLQTEGDPEDAGDA